MLYFCLAKLGCNIDRQYVFHARVFFLCPLKAALCPALPCVCMWNEVGYISCLDGCKLCHQGHMRCTRIVCRGGIQWNRHVVILMKSSSLTALKVVILTTFSTANDEDFIKMMIFPFQCNIQMWFWARINNYIPQFSVGCPHLDLRSLLLVPKS